MRPVFSVAEARTIAERSQSVGPLENQRPCSASVEKMGKAMATMPVTAGGKELNSNLWDVKEVAEFLGLAVGTVYHLLSQKRLPCVRLSARCVRFDPRQIEAWIAERTEEPEAR